ncbi:Plasma membrane t-SNARE, secretory vesicle fusion [Orbilia oligospora]|uniref:Plasma membrane t-SNARE, secretory vesicle fusion n=1 Tax=Orbilia oligospora TaxID=2813651 RepID=A0A7C8R9H5_ORBOL|nr:Plasma membrane t-SNARE, secretory vesicle fusion [Orbilia oligospora]
MPIADFFSRRAFDWSLYYGQQNPYAQQNTGYSNDQYGPSNYQGQGQQGGNGGYEMAPLNGQPYQQATNPQVFFGRIAELRQMDEDINSRISDLERLQNESLGHVDESSSAEATRHIDALVAEISTMNRAMAGKIRQLKTEALHDQDKANQVGPLERKFKQTLTTYQQIEVAYQKRSRELLVRQYKIANPNATDDQIRDIQEAEPNAQIFTQATMQGNRTGAARSALAEVRSRHNDIQKIEKTMVELAQLFEQMNELVEAQGEVVKDIEDHGVRAEEDTRQAVVQLDTAIKSAEGARRKKWWCLLLVLIIIIIIVIIVVAVTQPWKKS